MSQPETILAFDFGLRRIGVAVGQNITGSASPLGVVANRVTGVDFKAIDALIKEWQPDRLVVGMPLLADGTASSLQTPIDTFIEALNRFRIGVVTVDERYTSVEAEDALKRARVAGTRGKISREMIDSAAAVFIAERYLSSG